jgi:HTH-type transcriptional regulator, global nitrogen regulator NrpRI
MNKQEKKRIAILDVLKNSSKPISSSKICSTLNVQGIDISERTVRLYLHDFDQAGFTQCNGRKGRLITPQGIKEIEECAALERIGFLSGKIDTMAYRMNFDPDTCEGSVVINTSIVPIDELTHQRRLLINKVFSQGYAMGKMMGLFKPGSNWSGQTIPANMVGIATVCSITLNGVLLRKGIPVTSRFGGLLELKSGNPTRFVELIRYDGTSIDPLEIFIRSGMADYVGAVTTGNGRIGASFREFPAESISIVRSVTDKLESIGLGSLICIGNPGQPIFDFPMAQGRAGAVVIGGLNPMSIFEETGLRVVSNALSGIMDFKDLFPYTQFNQKLEEVKSAALQWQKKKF